MEEIITNEQIIAGNKLIAEYDGYVLEEDGVYRDRTGDCKASRLDADGFPYHESWDWLMPVLKKIAEQNDIYASGICETIKKNNFNLLPIWETVVKHFHFRKTRVKIQGPV